MRRRLSGFLTVVVLLTASAASAQDAPAGQDPTGQDAEAREHFEIARRYYELGQFREAAAEFEEAYRISPRPQLLMNIYLSYRDAADPVNATRALRAYLESDHPSESDRPALQTRLRALERQVAEQAAATPDETIPAEATPPEPAPTSRTPDVVGPVIVLTAGGALLLAGVATGAATVAEHGALEAACSDRICDEADAGRIDTVRALGITTDVLLGVGLAAATAGLVWLIVELDAGGSDADAETARLQCGGLGCSVGGTF